MKAGARKKGLPKETANVKEGGKLKLNRLEFAALVESAQTIRTGEQGRRLV